MKTGQSVAAAIAGRIAAIGHRVLTDGLLADGEAGLVFGAGTEILGVDLYDGLSVRLRASWASRNSLMR